MEGSSGKSFIPTNLGRVDEEMILLGREISQRYTSHEQDTKRRDTIIHNKCKKYCLKCDTKKARKSIELQLSQTFAQAAKPSAISTTTQIDPNIICTPLQSVKPISSANQMPSTTTVPVVSTA
ncbi:hypothetical protein TNCV_1861711 [Trichonephila clavipes]|nr:hypothetical protein TNCV_1861711 [Trichonephila clavipes]